MDFLQNAFPYSMEKYPFSLSGSEQGSRWQLLLKKPLDMRTKSILGFRIVGKKVCTISSKWYGEYSI
jgi:hypothetical protein